MIIGYSSSISYIGIGMWKISWSVYFSIYLNIINHINHKQRTLVYIIPCFNVSSPKSTGFPPPSYTSLSHELILDHFTRIPRQFFYCRRSQLLKPNFFRKGIFVEDFIYIHSRKFYFYCFCTRGKGYQQHLI